jgi:branched-chain amino acid transport system permease protein
MIPARAALAAFVIFLATAPLFLSEYQVTLMNYIGLATMIALGLVLLTGVAGVMSFGQQVFAGLAAYTSAVLTTKYAASPWLGLLLGLAIVAAVSLFIGAITLRLSGHYLPISTIAWGIAIYFMFGNMELLGKHTGLPDLPPISFFGLVLNTGGKIYYLIWVVALALLLASANLLDSRTGRAIRALRYRAVMAESFGVDTARLKIVVFVYAALFAALSGWLYAHFLRFVSPSAFNVNAGIDYLFMAVIGGASHVWGAVIGASVLTLLKESLKDLLPTSFGASGNYEVVVFGVLMLLLLHRASSGLGPLLSRWLIKPRRRQLALDSESLSKRAMPADGVLLKVEGTSKRFGGLVAVRALSFEVRRGEILGLIGPNGAGKSTMFNLATGVLPCDGAA